MATEDNPKKQSAMASLLSTAKSAAQLAAKQAEKTKLTTITLPGQYRTLGKHCYESQQRRSEFPDLFQKLDAIRSQVAAIAKSSEGQPTAKSLADKAKATAGKAMQSAQAQKLSAQQSSLFGALGKAVYDAHGENSGPSNLTGPIAKSLARLSELDADVSRLSAEGKGSWITPKRLAIVGAVAFGMFGLLMLAAVLAPAVDQARQAARRKASEQGSQTVKERPDQSAQAAGSRSQKTTDFLTADESKAMRNPIAAKNLSASEKLRRNRGVEFVRSTDYPEMGYFLKDGRSTKDATFYKGTDSIHWLTVYQPDHATKANWLHFTKDGWLYLKQDYDTKGNETCAARFRSDHTIESESFSSDGVSQKTLWYYENGQLGTEYRDDPRASSSSNKYWDNKGNSITQDQFCVARFGEDWRRDFSLQGDRNMKENVRTINDEFSRIKKRNDGQ